MFSNTIVQSDEGWSAYFHFVVLVLQGYSKPELFTDFQIICRPSTVDMPSELEVETLVESDIFREVKITLAERAKYINKYIVYNEIYIYIYN